MPGGEAGAKLRGVQGTLQEFITASTNEARMSWVAGGAAHRESIEKFFEANPGGPRITAMDPNVGLFSELPSGDEVKLYVAMTARCPSGAMVRFRSEAGKDKLDWPLFQQTHQLEFDQFAASANASPRWFSVLCVRSRTSGIQGPASMEHLALSAQGSLTVRGESALYAKRDTHAGKFLDSRMVWGRVYLVEVQLEHATVNRKPVLLVRDCAGTPTSGR
jgi:hypothetical protein